MQARNRVVATAVAVTLAAVVPTATVAQDSALGQVIEAVGGADALNGLGSFAIEASGERIVLDQGASPDKAAEGTAFTSVSTHDVAGDRMHIAYLNGPNEFGPARDVTEVVAGNVGFIAGQDLIVAPPGSMPMLSDRATSSRIHQQLLNPHLLLIDALPDPSSASAGDGWVEIAHGATPITLWLDDTGLISRATTMESNPLRRDVDLVVEYGDWADAGSGILFPGSVRVMYDGTLVHEEERTASTGVAIDDALFATPNGVEPTFDEALAMRGEVNHQYLQSYAAVGFPQDGYKPIMAIEEVGPGVFHIAGVTHNAMAVVQDDGIVIVDAPMNEVRTEAILSWVEQQGLPVTHIVLSHHHSDHSGGIRSLAGATGATVVVGEPAVAFFEENVFGGPSDIVPDGVDGSTIEVVGVGAEPMVIGSGANPVTVYAFGNPHAEDFVLVESGGALFVVDIFSPGFGPLPPVLFDFVESQGIEVDQVVGGHGATEPWEDLLAARE